MKRTIAIFTVMSTLSTMLTLAAFYVGQQNAPMYSIRTVEGRTDLSTVIDDQTSIANNCIDDEFSTMEDSCENDLACLREQIKLCIVDSQ